MPRTIRFHLDEHVPHAVADGLRRFGIDVTTLCPGWIRTPLTAHLNLPPGEVMEVDKAANVILDAIARKRPFLAFPAKLAWRVRLLRYLPRPISDWMTRRHLERVEKVLRRG